MKKNIANIITLSRIPFAIALLLAAPFSTSFWVSYVCGGLTDVIDGFAARKLGQQSAAGAKLDSFADGVFGMAVAIVVIINIDIPGWLWIMILFIAFLRLVGYGIGFYKYHTFSSLHTYANKVAGTFLFAAPILYIFLGLTVTEMILCAAALASALEEAAITVKSRELNRDCKSIWAR